MNKVLVCLNGSKLSHAICDYGIFIAKKFDLPLVLLNVIEHTHISKKIDLSGNIGLGTKDDLLLELANEEISESRQLISKGKIILKEMEEYIKSKNIANYTILQKHGTLYETLDELSKDLKIAIIGFEDEHLLNIESYMEELIRTLTIPILIVKNEFKPIESILMAYDGSDYANKSIKIAIQNPIFPNVKRYIVNVNKNIAISNKLLSDAKKIFDKKDFDVELKSLTGDAVESILEFQEKNNIDIIAMGAYSHNRFKSMIFGSFTTKMLLNTNRSLLLFR